MTNFVTNVLYGASDIIPLSELIGLVTNQMVIHRLDLHLTITAAKNRDPTRFPKVTTIQFRGTLQIGMRRLRAAIGITFRTVIHLHFTDLWDSIPSCCS